MIPAGCAPQGMWPFQQDDIVYNRSGHTELVIIKYDNHSKCSREGFFLHFSNVLATNLFLPENDIAYQM